MSAKQSNLFEFVLPKRIVVLFQCGIFIHDCRENHGIFLNLSEFIQNGMNGSFYKMWMLLAIAFLVFAFLSTFENLSIFGRQIAKINLPEFQRTENRQYLRNAEPVAEYEKTDTLPKTILFIGDSMLEGLSPRFAAYAQENGHRLYTVIWYGSTTEKWAESRRLTSYIAQYHPDFIVVCLGGNELFVKDIIEKRTKYADAIIAEAGEVPLLWIGPPNWKEDTGINRMLLSVLGNKRFYESKDLILDRAKDGMHPTRVASRAWMDSVAHWIVKQSAYPIKMNKPSATTARATKTIVLTPDD